MDEPMNQPTIEYKMIWIKFGVGNKFECIAIRIWILLLNKKKSTI